MPFEGPCTVMGGLPLFAKCTGGVDDSPVCGREYWSEVTSLHWLKKDGTPGKEISQVMYDKIEKYDEWWQAGVTEQVSDYLAYHQYLEENKDQPQPEMVKFDD